eukprot:jgi/Tetstr1/441345/TSEL_029596.t1
MEADLESFVVHGAEEAVDAIAGELGGGGVEEAGVDETLGDSLLAADMGGGGTNVAWEADAAMLAANEQTGGALAISAKAVVATPASSSRTASAWSPVPMSRFWGALSQDMADTQERIVVRRPSGTLSGGCDVGR